MAQPKVFNGYNYYQQPNGEWLRGEPVEAAPPQGVVLPPAPPPPVQAPGRTPGGAATEGLKPGFMWIDPSNPAAGQVPIPTAGAGAPRPDMTAASYADAIQARTDAESLLRIAADLRTKFATGPGSTTGFAGFQDYLPTAENRQFNDAGQRARGFVKRALGFTGGEGNTVAESSALYEPYLPKAGDRDEQILDKISALEQLAYDAAIRSSQITGQEPPAWAQSGEPPNALTAIRLGGGGPDVQAVPVGDAGQAIRDPRDIPPGYVQEADAITARLVAENGGRLDPQAFAAARAALDQKFGLPPTPPEELQGWAQSVNQYLDSGGRTIPSGVLPAERIMSRAETAANNLVNNPLTANAIGFADTFSGGLTTALAPDEMAVLRDSQCLAMLPGDIAGAIGGTSAIGKIGRATIGRAIPRTLGGQGGAQFGRNLATDIVYGGTYGGVTEGDPLTGAGLAAIGSTVGQGVGRGLGATVGGVRTTPEAQALRQQGVPISVARQMGMGRAEDLMQSLPFAGDQVLARQADSFAGFDEAGFRIGARPAERLSNPIAANMGNIGRAGIKDLKKVEDQAYDQALGGVNIPVDQQFYADFPQVAQMVQNLPADYRNAAESVIRNRVATALSGGNVTGKEYQQAIRGLRNARSKAGMVGQTGFEDKYVEALDAAENALTGVIQRNAGQGVIDDLALANEIYSNRKILENASLDRAKVGTRSGEVNVFTPSQLLESTRAAERRYGTGEELRQFAEAGQKVLPSTVPNTGTADRMLFNTALTTGGLGGLAALSGGGSYAAGSSPLEATGDAGQTALTGGGALLALSLLGTRGGQRVLERTLIDRPEALRGVGNAIRRRQGIFGSAFIPVAQEIYR